MKNKGSNSGKGRGPGTEDQSLWDFVTRGITPLRRRGRVPVAAPVPPPERVDSGVDLVGFDPSFGLAPGPISPDRPADHKTDRQTARKLRRGEIAVEAVLDLHGLRQGEAQDKLFLFLQQAAASGRRCVMVITGKGRRNPHDQVAGEQESGVLRRMLPHWLSLPPVATIVLDHSPAIRQHGGDGAFYILLRRRR